MSGGKSTRKKGRKDESSKEVEELLSAAEDQMLLNISTGSHITRNTSLDSDLVRRLEALKTPSSSTGITRVPPMKDRERVVVVSAVVDEELQRILGEDLSARFSALKGTSSSREFQARPKKLDDDDDNVDVDDDGVSKEVDKLMQWAMDEARLNPSMSSDDDDDDDDVKEQSKKDKGKR
ncbi:uncharacterized protein LOC131230827 [Magnolia sinica]|uniref:uncharacterized protein LOC131230827 n=1 Tax=Magnolia sinica TaxID=86752 RepID=UPI002658A409|nr:uncharacterized protein LOC131230827 [Magnolia sinica]